MTAAFADSAWTRYQDPKHDVAFLRVAPQRFAGVTKNIEQVVGGGNYLGYAPASGRSVLVAGYNMGVGGSAIGCRVPAYYSGAYPAINCHGYVGGSSGGPWLSTTGGRTYVCGVIGGLHQGGCYEYTSYTSPFGAPTFRLLSTATYGRGMSLPAPGSDGC